jgi:dihydrodipicolinate synthase/N-acetylneuraminate lyase
MDPHGSFPALPSVLHDDGTVDLDGQRTLAATVAAAGVDGVVVLGLTSGEVGDLTADERAAVVRATRDGTGGLPVLVGVGASGPGLLESARRAAGAGADGLLAALTSDPVGRDRLSEVAGLGLPLWLQHHPVVTGASIDLTVVTEVCLDLAPRAVVVEQAPSADLVAALLAAGGPPTFGGLAGLFLPEELEAGAVGTIAGGAVPERLTEVVARHRAEEPGASRDAFLELLPYLRLEVGSPGLLVRKEAWRQRGIIGSARVRRGAPLGTATKQAITRRLRDARVTVQAPYPGA